MSRENKVGLAMVALVVVGVVAHQLEDRCVGAWLRYGVEVPQCPAGDVHVTASLNANGLRRGAKGVVSVEASVLYVVDNAESVQTVPIAVKSAQVELVRDDKVLRALDFDTKDAPRETSDGLTAWLTLPADLQDGDYVLRAHVKTRAGDAVVDAPLPVYAPAKIHLLTDRPLYQPGNTMQFRAVVLRARDLVPLDGRPGRFQILDPANTVVLDEKVDAGDFGIADGEMPLDKSAPTGKWHVRFESGGAADDVVVDVKPFTLPRFTVSVDAEKPFYRRKDEPRVRVKVAYASGVPAQATLDVEWQAPGGAGVWPAPPEWLAQFPKTARTDKSGHAELVLPRVPGDLMGKASLTAIVTAHDDTGDAQTGVGSIALSEDAIDAQLVTELGDHTQLVDGVNNRGYLRATTAAGVPLANVTLTVKRAWDAKDKGIVVDTDEDGVAVLQLDPGPAVTVVIPPLPVRLPPPQPAVSRTSLSEMLQGDTAMNDIAAIDRWNPLIARECARFGENEEHNVSVRVEPSGRVARAFGSGDAGACIARILVGQQLPAGGPRVFQLGYTLDPPLATIGSESMGESLPDSLTDELTHDLLDARDCVGRMANGAVLPRLIVWEIVDGRFSADLERAPVGDGVTVLDDAKTRCIEAKIAPLLRPRALEDDAGENEPARPTKRVARRPPPQKGADAFGALRLTVEPVQVPGMASKPQATTMLGYELLVSAKAGDEVLGDTKVRVTPGAVPPLRLRASKVIADAGDDVTIDLLRGPDFHGALPKKLTLASVDVSIESDVDAKTKSAKFTLPKDKDGWYQASFDGAVARVFVPKREQLFVDVTPDKRIYRPGEHAHLGVTTREGGAAGKGVKAAVGLVGVDQTLETLAALPAPGDMERLVPTVQMSKKAFDVIDATALSLGRVRGKNAQAAAVLFVSNVPTPDALDVTVSASATTPFDPVAPLADRFYAVLEQLYKETRAFEQKASKDDKITPEKMLALWDQALDDAAKKGPVTDAFGRRLKLHLLPDDLVALTDPRVVVADGTRLPEDVEPWIPFVRRSAK